ncbi:MAG TPA: hypothetical protein VNM67_24685 [Thermoanaerobaculia bacterium]|jgi:hypothetical protein|nr:hypothetical protein [Thermoanaerobaculia bacterium]
MFVMLLAGASGSGRIDELCNPLCLRDATVFEELRGPARSSLDAPLFFGVSPDEEWVAVFQSTLHTEIVKATHVPTGKTSKAVHAGAGGNWWVDCFSPDGGMLYMGKEAASLVPGAGELFFKPRASVGGGTSLAGRKGSQQAALQALNATDKGGQGKVASVDLAPVIEMDQKRTAGPALAERVFGKVVLGMGSPDRDFEGGFLEQLSLSPDGKLVAGIAHVEGTESYGVVIPLEQRPLVARPFARNLVGRLVWSRDSRRIWFYARPDHSVEGTVYRVEVEKVLRGRS